MKNKEFISLELHLKKGFFCRQKRFEKMLYALSFEFQGQTIEIHKFSEQMNRMRLFYYLSPSDEKDLGNEFRDFVKNKLEEMKKDYNFSYNLS